MILNIQNLNKNTYLFAMANILVTGGTGFIGIPLVKKLHELGHNLKLLVRESSNIAPFEELSKIEYIIPIFHLGCDISIFCIVFINNCFQG